MKAEYVVAAVERFFLDLIGTVLPGGVLLGGVWLVLTRPDVPLVSFPPEDLAGWTLLVALSYIGGHLVSSVSRLVEGAFGRVGSWTKSLCSKAKSPKWLVDWISGFLRNISSREGLSKEIVEGAEFREFARIASAHFPVIFGTGSPNIHAARDIAISLAPQPDRIFRFRFLSLLNFGVATAILVALVTWAGLSLPWPTAQLTLEPEPLAGGWCFVFVVVALFLIERGFYFRSISLRVPFSMGAVVLSQESREREGRARAPVQERGETILYLAGGFRSGWQERVAGVWRGRIINPRKHDLKQAKAFTFWDLEAVRASDWVLAYLEATNPGGYALALEVGFAKALGKRVLLVDEKSATDETAARHLAMLRAVADVTFETLDEAVRFLATWDVEKHTEEE